MPTRPVRSFDSHGPSRVGTLGDRFCRSTTRTAECSLLSLSVPLRFGGVQGWAIAVGALAFQGAARPASTSWDRRVVDVAQVGDARSELAHGYVGEKATRGEKGGVTFRHASGFMRFALTTFEDTEVTVACSFVATDSLEHRFDVIVEDSLVATRTWKAPAAIQSVASDAVTASFIVEVTVPFALTKGKNNIAVTLRARDGQTPALREIRTIQDHLEDRSDVALIIHSQNRSGVVR